MESTHHRVTLELRVSGEDHERTSENVPYLVIEERFGEIQREGKKTLKDPSNAKICVACPRNRMRGFCQRHLKSQSRGSLYSVIIPGIRVKPASEQHVLRTSDKRSAAQLA